MTLRKLDCRPAILNDLRARRRQLGATSPQAFAHVYLQHHFHTPPSRMHSDLFRVLAEATQERGRRLAFAAPRGHAKTTVVSLSYVLWSALYATERFILIVSATREQATQLLADIRRELTGNDMLIEDFPEICEPLIRGRGGVTVKGHHLVLPNDICIRVLGSGQGLRGMKHREHRPTLIIGDDLEELDQAISEDQRFKLQDWFSKTLLKAGTRKTNVAIVGTVLHYDSLLARLTDPRKLRDRGVGWENRKYQAVESFSARQDLWDRWESIRFGEEEHEGKSGETASKEYYKVHRDEMQEDTQVLWPQREDYYHLMCIRADEGRASFQSEKQNEPLDPSECLFKENLFRFWDKPAHAPGLESRGADDTYMDVEELIAAMGKHAEFYGACDPSLGKRVGRGDYSGIITLVKHAETGVMYVIGAEIARRRPEQVIEYIVQLARMYRFQRFVVESNQFQEVLANQLEDRVKKENLNLRIESLTTTSNKQGRIEALEPLIAQGRIRFSRRHQLLLEQLRQFPLGAHDDGPDALEMAVTWAVKRRYGSRTIKLIGW
jgi:predicted phage terminase large subunit-like protein